MRSWTLREKVVLLIRALATLWWLRLKVKLQELRHDWHHVRKNRSLRETNRQYQERRIKFQQQFPSVGKNLMFWFLLIDIAVVAVFLLGMCWTSWFAFQGIPRWVNPETVLPVVEPTKAPKDRTTRLDELTWLSPADSQSIRSEMNVINFVLLFGGTAKYANATVTLDQTWNQAPATNVRTLTVRGTAVEVEDLTGERYVLNLYQPFMFEGTNVVYMVDQTGKVWSHQLADIEFIELNLVTLPITIAPNTQLPFSR